MSYRIGVLEGDGIGREIVPATVRVVEAALAPALDSVEWVPLPSGWESIDRFGTPLTDDAFEALKRCDGWILGPNDGNSYPPEVKEAGPDDGGLRKRFELFANIRPSRNLPGVQALVRDVDLVIVRENLEGFYPEVNMFEGNAEMMPDENTALCIGVFTRRGIERIAHAAFQLAQRRRRRVTIVHKANALRRSSGFFRRVALEVARQYPDVEVDERLVDAMTASLVRHPQHFDVVLTENMFGDILSDLAGELVGSIGLSPAINTNADIAMAQAAHGAAPDIAGQGIANPTGMVLSAAMLLDWLGEKHADRAIAAAGARVVDAVSAVIAGGVKTRDLGGAASTEQFTRALVDHVTRASAEAVAAEVR